MGVDKPDIRTVVHLDPPSTAEAYIQEAGRGGRDGQVSQAVLLWGPLDQKRALAYPEGSRERILQQFAESGRCRREVLLAALGDSGGTACSGCDVCDHTAETTAPDNAEVLRYFRTQGPQSRHNACTALVDHFNRLHSPNLGMRIWEYKDFKTIITGLEAAGRLREGRFTKRVRIVRRRAG
jgi:ATP-dependent DNA helicase RecQ